MAQPAQNLRDIDVRNLRYDLWALLPDGSSVPLSHALIDMQWEEQPGELAVRLEAGLRADMRIQPTGKTVHELLPNGAFVVPRANWGFGWQDIADRMRIFARGIDSVTGVASLTAYDGLIPLQQGEHENVYGQEVTGGDAIRDLLETFGVPIGVIEGPSVPLPQLAVQGSLAEEINEILYKSYLLDPENREYVLRWNNGAAEVVLIDLESNRGNPVYWFSSARNAPGGTSNEDIHDLVTQVQIVGSSGVSLLNVSPGSAEQGDAPAVEQVGALIPPNNAPSESMRSFGTLRRILETGTGMNDSSAQEEAQTFLEQHGEPRREQTVPNLPDLPFLRKGDLVRIDIPEIGLFGPQIVSGVTHHAATATMRLQFVSTGTLIHRTRNVKQKQPAFLSPVSPGAGG